MINLYAFRFEGGYNMYVNAVIPPENRLGCFGSAGLLWSVSDHLAERLGEMPGPGGGCLPLALTLTFRPNGRYRFGDYCDESGFVDVCRDRKKIGRLCIERTKQMLGMSFRNFRGRHFSLAVRKREIGGYQ